MPALFTFEIRDAATIRDAILRGVRNGLIARGVANPNVTPGSDWFVWAQALANELEVVEANSAIKADEQMPDTATGDSLARIASIFGLSKQAAAGSAGGVVLSSSASTTVPTGSQLVDDSGLAYEVDVGGVYADGATIPIRAISTGAATNHEAGDVLRWSDTPPFADEKAVVATGGLVNGHDQEDDEGLRQRVFARLRNPPGSGNWEHVAEVAEASAPQVEKGFVYPAAEGPATVHVAVTAQTTDTSKNRDVDSTVMTAQVVPNVKGLLPEHAYIVVTTVANVAADVAIGLSLPEAPTANPPGPGGGWLNGTPWPAPDASTTWRTTVTGVTSTTIITVDAQTAPSVGVTRIAWLSPTDWKLYSALVVGVTGTAGAYAITLDNPLVGITTGAYIWPECVNAQTYVDALLAAFAAMGPGEKTTNASAFQRGFRHPRPASGWAYALGPTMLRAITDSGDEVEAAEFFHRTDGTTTTTGASGQVVPQVPGTISNPPNQFVPRNVAFYRIP